MARLPSRLRRRLKRSALATGEYRIFAAYGGSGSSHLAARLGAFARPDVWQPPFQGRRLVEWEALTREPGLLLDASGYDAPAADWEPFHRRTDRMFEDRIDPKRTIRENLVRFCRWLEASGNRVVFVHAAIMGLFSGSGIRNVTFLIRHPLHALASFAKPERHAAEVAALGGLESEKTIELWADRWNRTASEFLECRRRGLDPVLVRFEFADRDARVTDRHPSVFRDFRSSIRNTSPLSDTRAEQLRSLVADTYGELYGDWEL